MTARLPIALSLLIATGTMSNAPRSRPIAQTAGSATAAVPATIAIRFGRLVDGTGAVLTNAVVVVEGDRIRSVSTSPSAVVAEAEVIDLSRYTGLPGLIDVHTHLTFSYLPGREPRFPAIAMFLGQESARKTLESGVTTVRDLNAREFVDVAMRDLINMGAMVGPRMYVSGHGLIVTRSPAGSAPNPRSVDGPSEVMRAVRQLAATGVDWIKLFASTGSAQDLSGRQTFTFDEIKAAVDAAHPLGKRVAVHSYGPDAARDAVRAGADSIEHATDMDDATIVEMARKGTFYVPTIDHNRYYADNVETLGFNPASRARFHDFTERNLATARRAVAAGVRLAMGSDAAFTMFGENTRELAWFVRAGLTPEQAIRAATANGAALLGKEKELGAVAAGYYADIIAVEGDPLKDINVVINNVRWVMKNGVVVVNNAR
jgi:imidazolonepropionase-like amidohydrolase